MTAFESSLPLPVPGEPFSLPVAHPSRTSPFKPKPQTPLNPEQQQLHNKLIAHFNQLNFSLPTTLAALKTLYRKKSGNTGRGWFGSAPKDEEAIMQPLSEVEKMYWSSEAFLRCLRATKFNYEQALKRCEETCVWRREFGVTDGSLDAEKISVEGETGKELIFGYDVAGRPVLYMHPYRQNTQTGPRQIDFVVWCLERCIDLCPATDPPTEMLCLCIDFGASRKVKSQPTSLGQAKKVLDILQTYYCERLGKAICADIPGFFWPFYRLVGPFVDPRTKEKIRFLEGKPDATDLIPADQLQTMFGGNVEFEYNHSKYFTALDQLCAERREANFARWKKFGQGRCGLSEAIIRGARTPEGAVEDIKGGSTSTHNSIDTVIELQDPSKANKLENGVTLQPENENSVKSIQIEASQANGVQPTTTNIPPNSMNLPAATLPAPQPGEVTVAEATQPHDPPSDHEKNHSGAIGHLADKVTNSLHLHHHKDKFVDAPVAA